MAGASVAMMTSALLRHGIRHIVEVRSGVVEWLEEREYESFAQLRGSMSQRAAAHPAAYARANYIQVLRTYPATAGDRSRD
jgi:dihydroorotate dehydrogenase (fumarate)